MPSGGLFVDKNNSLLAALHVSDMEDYLVSFNLYPGALGRFQSYVGLWTVVGNEGNVFLGLSSTFTLGMGTGYAQR